MVVCRAIDDLLRYAKRTGLMAPFEEVYARNRLLERLSLSSYEPPEPPESPAPADDAPPLERILETLADHAVRQGLFADSPAARDQYETALMEVLTPRPAQVVDAFYRAYARSPREATDYFYTLSQDTNYIRRYRTALDRRWKTQTPYGAIDITINLAKPEKDPKDIAAARLLPHGGYPACLLCMENEGYAGRVDHPARHNHRIIPMNLGGEAWGLQYSPYIYYREHCIVLNQKHVPMAMNRGTFEKLFGFLEQFPHYFVGSNAELPIVGGSILSHEHFQGGRYTFAMELAPVERSVTLGGGFADVEAGVVRWPMSVIRIAHADKQKLVAAALYILAAWREYSDESAGIFARSGETPHNTVTPIARMRDEKFELDLVLRNNITTQEHPLGVFHPHAEYHNIKKENIGLIEVMGLAVLPARLLGEMDRLKQALLAGEDAALVEGIQKHASWVARWRGNYPAIGPDNVDEIIRDEIGRTFSAILEQAGVFKRDEAGQTAFDRFLAVL
ncbi:MAG: UDP-glucose--hexose-1-phosphate uridylyltransferase [Oscillospiraceae bacterium]|nr:UDP-glucose--hexose-1-phosphate uridylyltransferase [Oscillospiraceae bacterium]